MLIQFHYHCKILAAMTCVGLFLATPVARAATRTYNIVQLQSVVTASGKFIEDLFDVEPQGAGSLVTSYTGTIVVEYIFNIAVIIGKHKVQTIADIMMTMITFNNRVSNKFKVYTVPVAVDLVSFHEHIVTFP